MKPLKNRFTLRYLRPYGGRTVLYMTMVVLSVVFTMATALSVADFLRLLFGADDGNANNALSAVQEGNIISRSLQEVFVFFSGYSTMQALLYFSVMVFVLYALKNVFTYLANLQIGIIRARVVRDIRNDLFAHAMHLPVSFHTHQRRGDILSRFSNDIVEYDESILGSVQSLVVSIISLILYLIMLLLISPILTLVVLLALPFIGIVISGISRKLKQKSKSIQEKGSMLMSMIEETISGLKVIKSFNAIDFSNHRFSEANRGYTEGRTKMFRRIYLASPVSDTLGNTVVIVILLFGSWLILGNRGGLTPELFVSYLMMFVLMIPPTKELTTAISQIKKGHACADRLEEFLSVPKSEEYATADSPYEGCFAAISANNGGKEVGETRLPIEESSEVSVHGEVEFREVCFHYRPDVEVLHNISFSIPQGSMVALVGSSGSGKSTIADLLSRFYLPTKGSVLLDGTDIQTVPLQCYRKQIGMVSQDTVLFNDTIARNIAFGGDGSVDMEKVRQAAQIANAHQFIMQQPLGYDSVIGDGGSLLSGGQRQRLAIARALYTNPHLLILDEATSALDSLSEHEVQQALASALQGRKSLVIAHRLSTIQRADEILVLDKGRIVERGKHSELMNKGGRYSQLVNLQRLLVLWLMPLIFACLPFAGLKAQNIVQSNNIQLSLSQADEATGGWTGHPLLEWSTPHAIDTFHVYRQVDGEDDFLHVASTTQTSFTEQLPHTVCARVVSYYVEGRSGDTLATSNTEGLAFYRIEPTQGVSRFRVSVEGNPQRAVLQWDLSPDPDIMGYFICSGEPCMELDTLWDASATSFVVNQFPVTEAHAFRLYAFDSCHTASPLTDPVCNIVLTLSTSDCDGNATVSFTPYKNMIGGLLSYEIQRSVNGGAFNTINTLTPDQLDAIVSIPANATNVSFRIKAVGGEGDEVFSNKVEASFSTADTAQFLTIQSVSVMENEAGVVIRMVVDPTYEPAQGYALYRKIGSGSFDLLARLPYQTDGVLTYSDRSVNPRNNIYTFKLGCLDGCGRNERFSPEASSVQVVATEQPNGVLLQWNAYHAWATPAHYQLFRKTESSSHWTEVVATPTLSHIDPLVDISEPMMYRIVASGSPDGVGSDSLLSSIAVYSRASVVWMPNAFMPNETTNNRFGPQAAFLSSQGYSLAIFARNGNLLFYSTDPSETWDGTYQGVAMPQDAYLYILNYIFEKGCPRVLKGTVLLIR